jgi:SAM-dependent methyltransferase
MKERKSFSYEGRELEVLAKLSNYHDWIVEQFVPYLKGHAAEIGAGTGTMTLKLRPLVHTLVAVEPAANLLPLLRQRLSNADIEIAASTAEEFLHEAKSKSFDAIVMVNVLEHIEKDKDTLRECCRVLMPEGHLLLFVPAMPMLFSDLDHAFGHYRRYKRRQLADLLTEAGLTVVELRYFDLPGAIAWWLVYKVLGSIDVSSGGAELYDRLIVPLVRRVERLLPLAFGKNLVAVARPCR